MERAPPAYMGRPRRKPPSPGRQWFVARRFATLAASSFQLPLHGFPSSSGCRHARHVIPKAETAHNAEKQARWRERNIILLADDAREIAAKLIAMDDQAKLRINDHLKHPDRTPTERAI